jgi:hypothetical protein
VSSTNEKGPQRRQIGAEIGRRAANSTRQVRSRAFPKGETQVRRTTLTTQAVHHDKNAGTLDNRSLEEATQMVFARQHPSDIQKT